MVRGTAAQQRAYRAAKRPAFPRPGGRAPSGCSWDKENGGWLRQDGSEWTAVRNEKRTLARAEKKARKKEKEGKEEKEEKDEKEEKEEKEEKAEKEDGIIVEIHKKTMYIHEDLWRYWN